MLVDVKSNGKEEIIINGQNKLYNTNKIDSYGDHRLAMMIACAQIVSGGVVNYERCIDVSFPEFKEIVTRIIVR